MLETLAVTGPIFVLIGIGYAAARASVLDPEGVAGLGLYVVNLALPALIFSALSGQDLRAIADPGYLLAYLAGSLATLGMGYLWSRRAAGAGALPSALRAMGMAGANSGFVGYPILAVAMPTVAAPALALSMVVENLVLIPLVLALVERGRGAASGAAVTRLILRRLATSPILLAIAAGLLVSLARPDLPAAAERTVDLLARSSAAVSLVAIGGALAALPAARVDPSVVPIVLGKLVLHPLATALAFAAMPALGLAVEGDLARAGVLMAAMPVMSLYPILAAQHGEGPTAAMAMLGTTTLSFVTLSALLALLAP